MKGDVESIKSELAIVSETQDSDRSNTSKLVMGLKRDLADGKSTQKSKAKETTKRINQVAFSTRHLSCACSLNTYTGALEDGTPPNTRARGVC